MLMLERRDYSRARNVLLEDRVSTRQLMKIIPPNLLKRNVPKKLFTSYHTSSHSGLLTAVVAKTP